MTGVVNINCNDCFDDKFCIECVKCYKNKILDFKNLNDETILDSINKKIVKKIQYDIDD